MATTFSQLGAFGINSLKPVPKKKKPTVLLSHPATGPQALGDVPTSWTMPKSSLPPITAPTGTSPISVGNTGSSPGGGGGGWSPGDINSYVGEIEGDPTYKQALANFNLALQTGRNSLRDQIRSAVIQGGWDITGNLTGNLAQYAGDLDAATKAAAASNQLSQRAQLQQQLDRGNSALDYQLAARGAYASGENPVRRGLLQEQYQLATNQGMNDLINAIRGGVSSYADFQANQQGQLQQTRVAVADRLAQLQAQRELAAAYASAASQPTYEGPVAGVDWNPNAPAVSDWFAPLGNLSLADMQRVAIAGPGAQNVPKAAPSRYYTTQAQARAAAGGRPIKFTSGRGYYVG